MKRRQLLGALSGAAAIALAPSTGRAAGGSDALSAVARRLDQAPVLRGRFEQAKTLRGFRKPLRSLGSFVVARGQGVIWQTSEPFASLLVFTRDKLENRSVSGAVERLDARREPGLRVINDMLLAMLSGDAASLAAAFDVQSASVSGSAWRLELTPRDPALRRFVTEVQLAGYSHVAEAVLHEASGDRTEIRFLDHTSGPLTAAEAAQLR